MTMLKKKISFTLSVMMLIGATTAFAGTTGDPFHASPSLMDNESISADECKNCGISVDGGHCDSSCNVILDRVELPVSEGTEEAVEVSGE